MKIRIDGADYVVRYTTIDDNGKQWYVLNADCFFGEWGNLWPADSVAKL